MRRKQAMLVAMTLWALLAAMMIANASQAAENEYSRYTLEGVSASLSNTQAGAHADFTATVKISSQNNVAFATTRDIVVELPQGLFGNVQAFQKCSTEQLASLPQDSKCPMDSQVGAMDITISGAAAGTCKDEPVYNMFEPGGDIVARFGFFACAYPMFLEARLDPNTHKLIATVENAPAAAELVESVTRFWAVPSASVHDPERITPLEVLNGKAPAGGRPSTLPETPFMTNPTNCALEGNVTTTVDSYQLPGVEFTKSVPFPQITGCKAVEFSPSTLLRPTTSQGVSGSGLDYELSLPTKGLQFGKLNYGSELKRSEVILPEGMTINPSEAVGLGVCSEADLARETYDSPPNAGCPETSKIGSVTAISPPVDQPAEGALYIAKPYENPFHTLLALYLVAKIPDRGVLVKIPGQITLDPNTGQITTVFDEIPQLPIASFHLHFREGARAPLITPFACGAYNAVSNMSPWSAPDSTVTKNNAFLVESGPGHSPCPASSTPPFGPSVISGMQNGAAGSYSPFYLRIMRGDAEQEITKFSTIMPPGVTGNLTGIPFCPDSAIEAARTKTGREELANPSCPAASEIGQSFVGAGVGDVLAQAPGKIYLAGPYHASALSVVSITSATVGPFDLGTVVLRFALRINPVSGQVEIDSTGSDPIPHILQGIVVHVRDIRVYIDREKFMINPTNCEPLSTTNTITGAGANIATPTDDTPVTVTTRFQDADCRALGFKPTLTGTTTGKTSRTKGASLSVRLTYPKTGLGTQANIRTVKVELPKQLPSRLSTLQQACTDTTFDQNPAGCPTSSRVGYAKAITPILPVPLEGPAYFVSHGGSKWPELIIVLQGYGVTIDLHGETFISKGITSSTFRTVPDQPVTSFQLTLPQGPDSALAAPSNLCHITRTILVKHKVHGKTRKTRKTLPSALLMPTTFTAQNGTVIHQNTKIAVTGCATARKHHRARS